MNIGLILCLLLLGLLILPNLRIVQEGERLVVFRLGRFHRILGPGLHAILWGVDAGQRVVLDDMLPGWQGMSDQDVGNQLGHLAATGQLRPPA